jgi:hypothetical protein
MAGKEADPCPQWVGAYNMLRSTLTALLLLVTCGLASGCKILAGGVLVSAFAVGEASTHLRFGDGPLVGRTLVATADVTYTSAEAVFVVPNRTLVAVTRARLSSGFPSHGPTRRLYGHVLDAGGSPTEFFVAGHRMKRNEDLPRELINAEKWDIVPAHIKSRAELDVWEAGERAADDAELLRRLRDRDWGIVARTLLLLRDRPMPSARFLDVARKLQSCHRQSLVRERASLVIRHWPTTPSPSGGANIAARPAGAVGN